MRMLRKVDGHWMALVPTWLLWGLIWFGVGVLVDLVPRILGQRTYVASGIAWTVLLGLAAWAIDHYRDSYESTLREFVQLTQIHRDQGTDEFVLTRFGSVYPKRARYLRGLEERWWQASFAAPLPLSLIVITGGLWFWTLLGMQSTYTGVAANVALGFFFGPIVVAGMWGSSIVLSVVLAFRRAVASDPRVPFSVARHPIFDRMERLWESIGGAVILIWLALLVAFAYGPHGLTGPLRWWLLMLALFPLFWFGVGSWEFRKIYLSVKRQHLERASLRVARLATALDCAAPQGRLQDLESAIAIEGRLHSMRVWPSAFNVGGLAISAAPVVFQAAVLISGGGVLP